MYKLIRNIHLVLGLIISPFLFIYAISGLFFSHHFLDFSSPEKTIEKFTLTSFSTDPAELAKQLSTKHAIHGQLISSKTDNLQALKLVISTTSKQHKVIVNTQTGETTNEVKTLSAFGFIKALHRTAGFPNEITSKWWWGLAVMCVAILLILLLLSGIFLWTYRRQERRTGSIFLGVSLVYCICVLCVLRLG